MSAPPHADHSAAHAAYIPGSPSAPWGRQAQADASKVQQAQADASKVQQAWVPAGWPKWLWPVLLLLLVLIQQAWHGHVMALEAEAQSARAQALLEEIGQHNASEAKEHKKMHDLEGKVQRQARAAAALQETVERLKDDKANVEKKESQTAVLLASEEEKLKHLADERRQMEKHMEEQEEELREERMKEAEDQQHQEQMKEEILELRARERSEKDAEQEALKDSTEARAKVAEERKHTQKLLEKLEEFRGKVGLQRANISRVTAELAETKAAAEKETVTLRANISLLNASLLAAQNAERESGDAVRRLSELLEKHKREETLSHRRMKTLEAQLKRLRAAHSEDVYELHEAQQKLQLQDEDEEVLFRPRKRGSSSTMLGEDLVSPDDLLSPDD